MEHIDFRDQISKNKRNSVFLMIFVAITIVILGYVISFAFDPSYFFLIMIVAIIFSISYTWVNFYNSDKIAISAVRAKPADKIKYRDFYRLVESLTVASSLPMPRLFIMESGSINAFASGRDPKHAVVCVTTGALEKLDRRELEGVLAHEMGHIANYDIRFITLVAVMVGMIAIVSQIFLRSLWFGGGGNDNKGSGIFILIGIALAILAPIVVTLVQLAISRKREFTADATAIKFTRNPNGLIGALEKIKKDSAPEKKVSKALAPLFFSSPFKGLSSTHPPLEKRIEVLKSM
ncbi:M48 family metallopeptidase [archaeon]|nr:M48 family metallopeptidase [archaeon]PJC45147.1 MAG: zinc metalloprotease HtpX [Candidatus Pacearchaeota archaeon CG_4_9_14_0_2_um_filter_30_8]